MDTLGMLKSFVKLAGELLFIIILSMLLVTFVGQRVEVEGQSMENTLEDGDNLILDKLSYRFHTPNRYDIIVFPHMDHGVEKYYIKRVIGLPGETLYIDEEGTIYINGEELKENYGKEKIWNPGIAQEPIALGTDEYFVLGDNRNNSSDSRDPEVGIIKRDELVGRAVFRIYPFNKAGSLSEK